MNRRAFVAVMAAGVVASPVGVRAQPRPKTWRIGYLGNSSASLEADLINAFRRGMRDLGYAEGRNIVIEFRWAEGNYDRFPRLVAELLQRHVDVIVTAGTPGTIAAKQATTTTPIVMAVSGDALGTGIVPSLARPGGNVTGLSTLITELDGKRLELLKQIVPKLSRVAVLTNPTNPVTVINWKQMQIPGKALQITLQPVEVRAVGDFDRAFVAIARERSDGLTIVGDRFLLTHRKRIVEFAVKHKLPAIYPYEEFVHDGGLMAYGPSYPAMFERAAIYVDKIFKGAKPAELPVEQPTKFDLMISMKTAKALGLTVPPALLQRADQLIE